MTPWRQLHTSRACPFGVGACCASWCANPFRASALPERQAGPGGNGSLLLTPLELLDRLAALVPPPRIPLNAPIRVHSSTILRFGSRL
jgi:hypothetical protein